MLENESPLKSEILQEIREGLVRHFLCTIVLIRLQNSTRLSGYDVVEFVNRRFGLFMSPGTIYSLLYTMERNGLIQGYTRNGKRTYEATDAGRRKAEAFIDSKDQVQNFIQAIIDRAQY